jgi:hypothetical protein
MIEDGTLVGKVDLSSPEADERGSLSQGLAFSDGPTTLPRPIQTGRRAYRPLTSHALIAITYANEDGTKEEGRTPKDPTRESRTLRCQRMVRAVSTPTSTPRSRINR